MSVVPFPDRFSRGSDHEKEVQRELERRNWTVLPKGMGSLPEQARRILSGWPNSLRYEPDMMACNIQDVWLVDAKDRMPATVGPNYSINKAEFEVHLQLHTADHIRVAYVFGNMSVATPIDVWNACIGPTGTLLDITRKFLVFPPRYARPMDDVFGRPVWWAEAEAA